MHRFSAGKLAKAGVEKESGAWKPLLAERGEIQKFNTY